jgi:hypothetical protein
MAADTTPEPKPVTGLAAKIARIADAIGDKEPIRHSRDIKFPYHSARDVYGWWRPWLQVEGIILVPSIRDGSDVNVIPVTLPRSGGGTRHTFLTTMVVHFRLIDGTTGEVIEGSAVGQGEDPSDKGAGKAMTYAEKAFLLGLGMNGSDSDVEAYADYEGGSSGPREVVVEDSNIEGIERGGRSTNATDVQVKRIRNLASDLKFGAGKTADLIEDILDVVITLPEDPEEVGPAFVRYLEKMGADDAGKVIQYMEKMTDDGGSQE